MRNWHGILAVLALVALGGAAQAQTAAIGVFFDSEATVSSTTFAGGPTNTQTAYIYAVNTEQPVGGVAFKLEKDPRITIWSTSYPAGVQVGTLTDGIQIGFSECFTGFFGVPILCATMVLWTGENSMDDAVLQVQPYPQSGTIQLADCNGEIRNIDGLSAYLTVPPQPAIGVFFDEAATQTNGTFGGGVAEIHTAYICAVHTEQPVGGAAFRLTHDARITLWGATYPAGVQIGTLTEGIQIGFTDCYAGFFGVPVLLSTLSLWTGDQLLDNAQLSIVAYPFTGTIQISDCVGNLRTVGGGTAYLNIPVGAESDSWGQVKVLYGE